MRIFSIYLIAYLFSVVNHLLYFFLFDLTMLRVGRLAWPLISCTVAVSCPYSIVCTSCSNIKCKVRLFSRALYISCMWALSIKTFRHITIMAKYLISFRIVIFFKPLIKSGTPSFNLSRVLMSPTVYMINS